jgi:hypothetical protein
MATVLAVGDGAFVSHRSAACLYGFLPYPPEIERARSRLRAGRSTVA